MNHTGPPDLEVNYNTEPSRREQRAALDALHRLYVASQCAGGRGALVQMRYYKGRLSIDEYDRTHQEKV